MGNMEKFVARREEVVKRHLAMESVPESPWSPDHPDMQKRLAKGEPLASDRIVVMVDDDNVVVVGACADRVAEALKEWLGKLAPDAKDKPYQTGVIFAVKHAKLEQEDDTPYFSFPSNRWNSINIALADQGLKCVITDA